MDLFGIWNKLKTFGIDVYQSDKLLLRISFFSIFAHFYIYITALYGFIFKNKPFHTTSPTAYVLTDDLWAQTQIYSLSLIFKMWNKKHYRNTNFKQDCLDTLVNVAIPGTGIPLSIFFYHYYLALFFVFFGNPLICFFGAFNKARKTYTNFDQFIDELNKHFISHLFHPQDWFSFWRLNCILSSYHSMITENIGYKNEDKWHFLVEGKRLDVPITPYLEVEDIVCKNTKIEGGLGIYFYKNATVGGDWIIQKKLGNAAWLNKLLPSNAPLSTMRVITTSTWSLTTAERDETSSVDSNSNIDCIQALSAVLRLGRANAMTDHSSILFNVDLATGEIGTGATNAHWYKLGLSAYKCPWLPGPDVTAHPDEPCPHVTSTVIPDFQHAIDLVKKSHYVMMKDVPIVGWDVAFTENDGINLLEVNLSCNFFRGKFDIPNYIAFVSSYFQKIEEQEKIGKEKTD